MRNVHNEILIIKQSGETASDDIKLLTMHSEIMPLTYLSPAVAVAGTFRKFCRSYEFHLSPRKNMTMVFFFLSVPFFLFFFFNFCYIHRRKGILYI